MSQSSELAELVDGIYDASTGLTTWTDFARQIEGALKGPTAIFVQRERPVEALAMCSDADDSRAREYLDGLWTDDRAMRRIRETSSFDVVLDRTLITDAEREDSEFYRGFLGRNNGHRGLYAPVQRGAETSVVLSVQRARWHGEYTPRELALVRRLQPHVERGLRISDRLRQARLLEAAALQALDENGLEAIFTASDGRVRFATAAAEHRLEQRGLTITHGRLRARAHQADQRLAAAIGGAARPFSTEACDVELPGRPASRVLVAPARHGTAAIAPEPLAMLLFAPVAEVNVDAAALRRAFDLTPAEARLLAALTEGERLQDFADRLGVSVATAKTHLASVFRKTGTRRQAELVRVALSVRCAQRPLAEWQAHD
jgi:DNA-binding CsgD family transcriptional regulator